MNAMKTLCIFLILLPCIANAEVTLKMYKEMKNEQFILSYVWGLTKGMVYVATINESKGGNVLFCPPDEYVFTGNNAIKLLDQEISGPLKIQKYSDDTPIELIYLYALEKKFPCNSK
ncbi:MAG TPA: hypothetical protein VIM85_10425 [Pseudomonadales bacterium]